MFALLARTSQNVVSALDGKEFCYIILIVVSTKKPDSQSYIMSWQKTEIHSKRFYLISVFLGIFLSKTRFDKYFARCHYCALASRFQQHL